MAGIPSELHHQLRKALLDCEQFESDHKLRSVFAYEPLKPWLKSLPEADSLTSRVDAVIAFLRERHRGDTQQNALVLLVRQLSELIDEDDERHQRFADLAQELENAVGSKLTTNSHIQKTNPETDIRGNAHIRDTEIRERRPIKNRWAFLVGVNHYNDPSVQPLKFCVEDVVALDEKLKALGYTVVCLHDRLDSSDPRFPIRNNVEAELIQLCSMVDPDDLLLVHFSCHGKLLTDKQPVLIIRDTRLPTLAKTGLPLAEVKQQMCSSKARRLVLTLDACHMGVETERGIDDAQFIHNVYELAEGFALIAASTAQQKAQESPDQKSGVFTYYLLEGLSGKADRGKKEFVTVDDLKTYVLDSLRRWSVENGGIIQEPTAQTEGLGDIILVDYRNVITRSR
jgi:hypothetical protein